MISKRMLKKLNEQINKEYYSSYLYLAMSIYCKSQSLDGFGVWLRAQSQEELQHALKFIHYIEERQEKPVLGPIAQPSSSFKSVQAVFSQVLEHERSITASIYELCELADEDKDYATKAELAWFVKEQVEEESTAQLIVEKLGMIGDSTGGLLYLDKDLGKRANKSS